MDGKRQQLETFRNKLVDARRRGFHFEQVRSRYVARRYLAFLQKTVFFKTKTCCVSTPDHMTAVEYSFNTSGCGVGEVFSKNPLHSVVQSAVDGKRQGLETFRNKLVDARRRGFHF